MNKKGFTLMELLAVIIILSLLAILTSTSVTKIVTNSKRELSDKQITLIKKAAETWGADNIYKLPSTDNECKYLTLEDLQTYGVIDSNIINFKNNKEFSSDINIKISATENNYNNVVLKYEVNSDISSCTPIYPKICTLVNDADNSNSITPGDKYQCKVKDNMEEGFENGYYFYVLSFNADGTINLIMDRNICEDDTVATSINTCLVAYNEDGDATGVGPVTAMNYLNNATKSWSNIPNLNIIYNDEGGNFTNFLVIQKARLPYHSEVNDVGCEVYIEKSCPTWMAEYLHDLGYEKYNGLPHIADIYGYWTFSSLADAPTYAKFVGHRGYENNDFVNRLTSFGVRPVITIPKYNLSNKTK